MKKLKLIGLVVFSIAYNCQGQDYQSFKSKKNYSASGYSLSIDRNFRNLVANDRDNSQNKIDFNDSISKPSIFISLGGNRIYSFSKNTYLDIGLLYLATGYHAIQEKEPEYTNDYLNLYPGPLPLNILKTKTIIKRKFLSVPVKFKCYFSKKKLKAFVSTGISLNFFIFGNALEIQYIEDGSKKKTP